MPLALATGASAGNINSVLSAISWCTEPEVNFPEVSVFWQIWINTGYEQIFPLHLDTDLQRQSILHRDYFEQVHKKTLLEILQNSPLGPGGCEIPMGISLTQLEADQVSLGEIEIATQRFVSVVRLVGSDSANGERMFSDRGFGV